MNPKFLLPVIGVLLFAVAVVAMLSFSGTATHTQSLSAIGSALAAISAVVIAFWTDQREQNKRAEEREKEQEEKRETRTTFAAIFSSQITAWLHRKQIQDIVSHLGAMEARDELRKSFKVVQINKEMHPDRPGQAGLDYWNSDIQRISVALQVETFKSLSMVPNIWETNFRHDNIRFLKGRDAAYFSIMGTIWTNLNLQVQQLIDSVFAIRKLQREEDQFVPIFADAMAEDALDLRTHINEFLAAAETGAQILADYAKYGVPGTLTSPAVLLVKSKVSSQRLAKAWQLPQLSRLAAVFAAIRRTGDVAKANLEDLQRRQEEQATAEPEHQDTVRMDAAKGEALTSRFQGEYE
jgi:hypothetical protein